MFKKNTFKSVHFFLFFFEGKRKNNVGAVKNADHPGNGARYAFTNAVKNIGYLLYM